MSPEHAVLDRLQVLERENRRMKRIGVMAIIIAASLLLMAQAPSKRRIEANEFVLRDSSGIVRSKWSMTSNGPELIFLDTAGNVRANIKMEPSGETQIRLNGPPDPNHKDRVQGELILAGPIQPLRTNDRRCCWGSPSISVESDGSISQLMPGYFRLLGRDRSTLVIDHSLFASYFTLEIKDGERRMMWQTP